MISRFGRRLFGVRPWFCPKSIPAVPSCVSAVWLASQERYKSGQRRALEVCKKVPTEESPPGLTRTSVTAANSPQSEPGRHLKDLDQTNIYIDKYTMATKISLQEVFVKVTRTSVRVAYSLQVPGKLLNENSLGISEVIGTGEGANKREANKLARIELGENLYNALKDPARYLSKRRTTRSAPAILEISPTAIPGLSTEPLTGDVEELKAAEERKFKDSNKANGFIDRYMALREVRPSEESGMSGKSTKFIRVAMSLAVDRELLKSDCSDISKVFGVGEAGKKSEARALARIDLAERLYAILEQPLLYLPEKDRRNFQDEHAQFIPVRISSELKDKLKETCGVLNETGVFQIDGLGDIEPSDGAPTRYRSSSNRVFTMVPEKTLAALSKPQREGMKLPIGNLYHKLVKTIEQNNVTVLSAATGSGKTTQLPQFILDNYLQARQHYDRPPSVLVTQPRRIAAKTVAQRVADERARFIPGADTTVGYSVRFDSKYPTNRSDGSVVFCTAGILLRRLQREPDLATVTHLILDEVHERDVFTDVLLLVVKIMLRKRPDLRVILMSATMEATKFINYFQSAGFNVGKVLDIEGTNHPVSEKYLDDIVPMLRKDGHNLEHASLEAQKFVTTELSSSTDDGMNEMIIKNADLQEIPFDMISNLIEVIVKHRPPGAILVFLPGWEEITELNGLLMAKHSSSQVEIHLLHSTSPIGSADAAFKRPPEGVRKIILATNIAESSVTIPDVVYVIDSGKQKVMHYDQKLRMNVLEPCWISKANLRQRLGRAGRCQPGHYFGFYSENRAKGLPEQTLPELLRLGLDEVCLNLKAMGFTQSSSILLSTAIDPPDRTAVKVALERLNGLGAIDDDEQLTPLGRLLANIPIHPAMGKMLITSLIFGCLGPVLTTVALLGQRVLRPARLAQEKYDLHAFFKTLPKALASDHLLFHFIYRTWKANGHDFGQELYRYSSLFSRPSLRRLDESRNQIFRELKGNFGLSGEDVDVNASNDSLVRLILASGFYPDVAIAKDRRNTFRLKKLPSATIGSSSMNYILGSGSIRNALEARGQRSDPLGLDKRRRRDGVHPQFVIYEELLDIGQKLVSKTTAIDPLSFILFAERYDYRFYKSGTEKIHKQLHLDGWLAYRAEKDPSDLSLINELRQHWNDFVQFVIYKQLKKETLSEHEEECVRAIKETIIMFANEMDIHRSMQQDRSVQVHASEAFQLQHARKSPSIEEQ